MKRIAACLLLLTLCFPALAENMEQAAGYVRGQKNTLLLTKHEFPCSEGWRRAIVYSNEYPFSKLGCWRRVEDKVQVVLEDGVGIDLLADGVNWTNGAPGKGA